MSGIWSQQRQADQNAWLPRRRRTGTGHWRPPSPGPSCGPQGIKGENRSGSSLEADRGLSKWRLLYLCFFKTFFCFQIHGESVGVFSLQFCDLSAMEAKPRDPVSPTPPSSLSRLLLPASSPISSCRTRAQGCDGWRRAGWEFVGEGWGAGHAACPRPSRSPATTSPRRCLRQPRIQPPDFPPGSQARCHFSFFQKDAQGLGPVPLGAEAACDFRPGIQHSDRRGPSSFLKPLPHPGEALVLLPSVTTSCGRCPRMSPGTQRHHASCLPKTPAAPPRPRKRSHTPGSFQGPPLGEDGFHLDGPHTRHLRESLSLGGRTPN